MSGLHLRFRVGPGLASEVRARDCETPREGQWARKDSAGWVARRDLGRYYDLLAGELAGLKLTEGEASLIADANNGLGALGWLEHAGSPAAWLRAHLLANTTDAVRFFGVVRKHGLTGKQATNLLERMRCWTPGQVLAVADAVERFWASQGATVASVGLVAPPIRSEGNGRAQ